MAEENDKYLDAIEDNDYSRNSWCFRRSIIRLIRHYFYLTGCNTL
jgi:hypothetical protein